MDIEEPSFSSLAIAALGCMGIGGPLFNSLATAALCSLFIFLSWVHYLCQNLLHACFELATD